MAQTKQIKSALISVFHKEGLSPILEKLHELNVQIFSTGGTEQFIKDQNMITNFNKLNFD